MLLDGHMLHLELTAGASGVAHAHGLWFEDVSLAEVAGCQLLKPGLILSALHFARFCQCSSFINLDYFTVRPLIEHTATDGIDAMQYYVPINIIKFKVLAVLTENHIPLRYTSDFPILPHHLPSAPRSLSKSSPTDGQD